VLGYVCPLRWKSRPIWRPFGPTLVNDPDDALTTIRLETLAHGAQSMVRIADFSKLG
jgi:hypothetical protein